MNTTLNGVSMEILNGGNGKRAAFKNKQTNKNVRISTELLANVSSDRPNFLNVNRDHGQRREKRNVILASDGHVAPTRKNSTSPEPRNPLSHYGRK